MTRARPGIVASLVCAFSLAAASAWAQDSASTDEEAAAKKAEAQKLDREEAIAELKLMSEFLSAAKSFSVEAEIGYDAVQLNGEKLEFGGTRKVTLRRPDRVRVEGQSREGAKRTLYFDGETISIDLPDDEAYVQVSKPGTLDQAIDYLVDDLHTPAPLADLLHSSVLAEVADRIESGGVVGEETVGGTPSIHVALRGEEVDAQLWIADGDEPLLQRIVLTYKNSAGSPQFWAQFSNWNLKAKTPDKLFAYTPPKGAEKLPIGTAVASAAQEREGSK